ncbi:MAG TPA: hypothetical protein VK568_04475 [Thermodesulfobacteriota bacterium]|nr:hypothetical protein [Thermodesulfobacteriota bacterium]
MLTLVPNLIPSFMKGSSKPSTGNQHLMLAGIHQTIFLNQWGEPETQIGLKRLGSFNKLGSFLLIKDPAEEVHHSIWIYKKRDRILFFTKKRLISHSRWSEFRQRVTDPKEEPEGRTPVKSSPFLTTTLSLVA